MTQAEPRATGLKAMVYNKSAFPARALTDGTFRYYFRPDGTGAGRRSPPATPRAARPRPTAKQFSGDIWYVEVDCAGHTIAPAGQSQHRMEVQFKIGVPEGGTWDPTNDPSYQADRRAQPQGAALRRRHPGLGRRAGPGRAGHHRADRARHARRVRPSRPPALTLTWTASTDTGGSGLAGYDVTAQLGPATTLVGSTATDDLAGRDRRCTPSGRTSSPSGARRRGQPSAASAAAQRHHAGRPAPRHHRADHARHARSPRRSPPPALTLTWAASTDNVGRHRLPGLPRGRRHRRRWSARPPAPRSR